MFLKIKALGEKNPKEKLTPPHPSTSEPPPAFHQVLPTLRSDRPLPQGERELKMREEKQKSPALPGSSQITNKQKDYLIFASLYMTCLRTTGSYFLISIFSGMVRLFLSVV
jgi:hypothetical protein